MRLAKYTRALLLTSLFLTPLAADEAEEEAIQCEKLYDLCWEKCETAKNASEECYDACEQEHEECISLTEEEL